MALLIEHDGTAAPRVHPTARVAPDATVRGDVSIGPGTTSAVPARNRAEA
jgi:carbonic anhydrase/acetyltransferase-like protein (isoleucine patch superfamily)